MSVTESAEAVKSSFADSESGEKWVQLTFENVRLSHRSHTASPNFSQ
jgi:hypothetical protein